MSAGKVDVLARPRPFWGNPVLTTLIPAASDRWQKLHASAKELDRIATDCCQARGQSNPDRDAHLCASQREQAQRGYVLARIATNIYGFCLRDTLNDGLGNILAAEGGKRGGDGSAERAIRFAIEWQAKDPENREVIFSEFSGDEQAEFAAALAKVQS